MNRYEVIRRGVMTGRRAGTTVWQVMDNETRHPSMVKYRPGSLPTWVASFADEAQAYRELMRLEDARARKLNANEQEVLSMHVNSCNELRAERDKLQTEATEARELAASRAVELGVLTDRYVKASSDRDDTAEALRQTEVLLARAREMLADMTALRDELKTEWIRTNAERKVHRVDAAAAKTRVEQLEAELARVGRVVDCYKQCATRDAAERSAERAAYWAAKPDSIITAPTAEVLRRERDYYKMRFEVISDPTYERERDELRAEVAKLKAAAKSDPCAPEVTGYAGSFGRLVSAIKRTLYLETAAGIASTVHAASSGREHIISIVLTG